MIEDPPRKLFVANDIAVVVKCLEIRKLQIFYQRNNGHQETVNFSILAQVTFVELTRERAFIYPY